MLSFVEYTSAHWPALQAFWQRVYGARYPLAVDHALFEWQFGAAAGGNYSPSGDQRYHLKIALDDDKVVGSLGYIPAEVVARGQSVRACWLANWMVAPELARVGVGRLLMQAVLAEVDGVVNVGISEEGQRQFARMGWLSLGTLSRWVCALQPDRADELLGANAEGVWPPDHPVRALQTSSAAHAVQVFGAEATRLWDDLWGAKGAGARRSADLLNWRYANHPTFHYELLELREARRLRGFAVYRIETVKEPALQVGRIVELVAPPSAAPALISAMCKHATTRGVAMMDFFCMSRVLDSALQAQGFQPGNSGRALHMPYLFQPIDRRQAGIACMVNATTADLPHEPDSWYVTKGDSDQDRPN